jgi:hypothetical protein
LINDGTSAWDLDAVTFTFAPDAECDGTNPGDDWSAVFSGVALGTIVAPGGSVTGSVDVTLAAGVDNDCQGDVVTVTATVDVSQNP